MRLLFDLQNLKIIKCDIKNVKVEDAEEISVSGNGSFLFHLNEKIPVPIKLFNESYHADYLITHLSNLK